MKAISVPAAVFCSLLVFLLLLTGCKRELASPGQVTIGDQTWMTENLDVDHYRNGDRIPEARSVAEWNAAISKQEGAWCYSMNDRAGAGRKGRLYNWYAVSDARGLAPMGWHVPGDREWSRLCDHLGGPGVAGGRLRGSGASASGFDLLFPGSRNCLGDFFGDGALAFFWSATVSGPFEAWDREISLSDARLGRVSVGKGLGLSVRCLKDN